MTGSRTPRARSGFAALLSASSVSNLADGVFKVALPLAALVYTRDPFLISLVTVASTLPWLVFALPAGVLVDRVDRRRAMLVANVVRAVAVGLAGGAVAAGVGSIPVLAALALVVGTAETVYDTAAQSILPQVVGRDRLPQANGRMYAAELTANQFVGPPLGGVLTAVSLALSFVTPAALWLLAVGILLLVPGRFAVERAEGVARSSIRSDLLEGLRFLFARRVLRVLAIMTGVFNFVSSAFFAVFVVYAVGPESELRLTEAAYGVLLTVIAVGSVLGGLVASRVQGLLGRTRSLAVALVGGAAYLLVPGLTGEVVVVGAAFFVGGVATMIWNIVAVSLRQRITPDRLLGRVNSAYRLLAWGSMPLGALLGGVLAGMLGVQPTFVLLAVPVVALLGCLPFVGDAAIARAEAEAEVEL